jgi:transcriptional regulator of acetoin/glycerol metabolism
MKKKAIESALEQTGGNISKAAILLGISRPTFYKYVKQFNSLPPMSEETPCLP